MPVDAETRDTYRALLRRRLDHEPVAYLIGTRGFLDDEFAVGPGVLIPRPETEELVLAVEGLLAGGAPRILDLGTGSGCIVLSLLARLDGSTGVGVDVSEDALAWARRNATAMELEDRVNFTCGDLFDAVEGERAFDVIVSNPPYIPEGRRSELMADVREHEPASALFAAGDGLGFYRRILEEAPSYLAPGGIVAMELPGYDGDAVVSFARAAFPDAEASWKADLSGKERLLLVRT